MRPRNLVPPVLLAVVVAVAAVLVLSHRHAQPQDRQLPNLGLWPTPQRLVERSDGFELTGPVTVLRHPDTDAAAVDLVTATLRAAGVAKVLLSAGDDGTGVTVWLSDTAGPLRQLGVEGSAGLPAEGYVLAAGRASNRGEIVLDGVDPAGVYYAAQTLRQLIRTSNGRPWMPGVTVHDWPSAGLRGVVEGFYGPPWTQRERLDALDYLAAHKANSYMYSPKDDPYLRERWRDPYPPDLLAQLRELIGRAVSDHVTFSYALSPGLSICYSSPGDIAALLAKLDSIYALGARSFAIPLDDIDEPPGSDHFVWHCPRDSAFGSGSGAAGAAQAQLLDRVDDWVRAKGDVRPLQIVPTEFYGVADSPYKTALREGLAPDVIVMWTGGSIVSPTITVDEATAARAVFGHDILLWDNYPVNDYIPGRLPLGPYTGRQDGLSGSLAGILSNPSIQPTVSRVGLFSVAAFDWNDSKFQPTAAWSAALQELAGGDSKAVAALQLFADVSWFDNTLHPKQAPRLAADFDAFWTSWRRGDRAGAITALRQRVDAIADAPAVIRARVPDRAFAAEAAAWLDAMVRWGNALQAATDMLAAEAANDDDGAAAAHGRIDAATTAAAAIRDTRQPDTTVPPSIGDSVIDRFLADADAEVSRWRGAQGHAGTASASMGTYQDDVPARMVDGDPDTFYSSDAPLQAGDSVTVDLGRARPVGAVSLLMSSADGPDDYVHHGTLEYSLDGQQWQPLGTGSTAELTVQAPPGTVARFVRYRATADNGGDWLAVREFAVAVDG